MSKPTVIQVPIDAKLAAGFDYYAGAAEGSRDELIRHALSAYLTGLADLEQWAAQPAEQAAIGEASADVAAGFAHEHDEAMAKLAAMRARHQARICE